MKFLLPAALISVVMPLAGACGDDPTAASPQAGKLEPLNIPWQLHTRYVVAGQEDERQGLWGPSTNFPKAISKEDRMGDPGKLSVVAIPDEKTRLGGIAGVELRIVNRPDDRLFFSAIDSHLFIVQEAQDDKGEWRPIERIPHGTGPRDCAVGFHRISLKPGQYWNLAGPRYAGPFKTKLRYRLDLGTNDGAFPTTGGKLIYSNEFEGTIHREQFERSGRTALDLNAP